MHASPLGDLPTAPSALELEPEHGQLIRRELGAVERERPESTARGREGGGAAKPARARIRRADGTWEDLPGKWVLRMRAGETLSLESAGGGGFGRTSPRRVARADRGAPVIPPRPASRL